MTRPGVDMAQRAEDDHALEAAIQGGAPEDAPHHENHGQTPAAWTSVAIMISSFIIGGLGLIFDTWWVFWAGVAVFFIGAIVGKLMQMMGLGQAPKYSHDYAAGDQV